MFITTLDKLKALKHKAVVDKENGAAMIFAVLLLMLMLFITLFVASTATTQAESARNQNLRESYLAAANDAIDYMLVNANINSTILETRRGSGNALTSTVRNTQYSTSSIVWKVYTEQVATSGSSLSYYVYATGYNTKIGEDKGVTLRATFESTTIDNAVYSSGNVLTYSIASDNPWGLGIMGTTKASIAGTGKLYSYESGRQGYVPSGATTAGSAVSSNGLVTLGSANTGTTSVVSSIPSSTAGCSPVAACAGVNVTYRGNNISLDRIAIDINAECPAASYPVWKASANGGVLNLGPTQRCVGGLIFDQNTTVPANFTESSPQKVYVKGAVTVNAGVNVNSTGSPLKLQVLSTGGNFTVSGGKTNMLYGSNNATCSIAGTGTTYFGALACADVAITGTSTVYYDISAKGVKTMGKQIWSKVYQEEM